MNSSVGRIVARLVGIACPVMIVFGQGAASAGEAAPAGAYSLLGPSGGLCARREGRDAAGQEAGATRGEGRRDPVILLGAVVLAAASAVVAAVDRGPAGGPETHEPAHAATNAGTPAPETGGPFEEDCGDGVDNDGDGLIDCDDCDCQVSGMCPTPDYAAPFEDICNDVLGYLNDADCARALKNLARHTGLALYLGVLTREDLALCDPERTDQAQSARPVAWYRRRLTRNFLAVGGGLYLRKPVDVTVWHLERG